MQTYLKATDIIDYYDVYIQNLAQELAKDAEDDISIADLMIICYQRLFENS